MQIDILQETSEGDYEAFLHALPTSMLFQSVRYRNMLRQVLPGAEDRYFLARETQGGRIVGALPTFVLRHPISGTVINSLPFFGSNGGVLSLPGVDRAPVAKVLLTALKAFAKDENAASTTVVSHPLDTEAALEIYRTELRPSAEDERIGQITPLPPLPVYSAAEAEVKLFALYHQKTRNVIRKAQSSGFEVTHEDTDEAMRELYAVHEENMTQIGGVVKPYSFFQIIQKTYRYDDDYRVYIARKDGRVAAALLVFYYNRIAEYFTPVTRAEFRILQPQSLLCLLGMQEAMRRGCTHWNWGGTGLAQTGVYEFKRKWGTEDHRYRYFIAERDDQPLRKLSRAELLGSFPNFFAIPFSVLPP